MSNCYIERVGAGYFARGWFWSVRSLDSFEGWSDPRRSAFPMDTNGDKESQELLSAKPRRIAILTAGGDAPGMNAAIRAVVRSAAVAGVEVIGFRRGYEGLIRDLAEPLDGRSVANMIQRGGTF